MAGWLTRQVGGWWGMGAEERLCRALLEPNQWALGLAIGMESSTLGEKNHSLSNNYKIAATTHGYLLCTEHWARPILKLQGVNVSYSWLYSQI